MLLDAPKDFFKTLEIMSIKAKYTFKWILFVVFYLTFFFIITAKLYREHFVYNK